MTDNQQHDVRLTDEPFSDGYTMHLSKIDDGWGPGWDRGDLHDLPMKIINEWVKSLDLPETRAEAEQDDRITVTVDSREYRDDWYARIRDAGQARYDSAEEEWVVYLDFEVSSDA